MTVKYMDVQRLKENNITPEMVGKYLGINVSNNLSYNEAVWYSPTHCHQLSSWGRTGDFRNYVDKYSNDEEDITDELISHFNKVKKEFDVYSTWGLLPEDIDTTKVAEWLEENTTLCYSEHKPTEVRWNHVYCDKDFQGGFTLYSDTPKESTPEALEFFKEQLGLTPAKSWHGSYVEVDNEEDCHLALKFLAELTGYKVRRYTKYQKHISECVRGDYNPFVWEHIDGDCYVGTSNMQFNTNLTQDFLEWKGQQLISTINKGVECVKDKPELVSSVVESEYTQLEVKCDIPRENKTKTLLNELF